MHSGRDNVKTETNEEFCFLRIWLSCRGNRPPYFLLKSKSFILNGKHLLTKTDKDVLRVHSWVSLLSPLWVRGGVKSKGLEMGVKIKSWNRSDRPDTRPISNRWGWTGVGMWISRGSVGRGWGSDVTWLWQLGSELTISVDYASSKISRYLQTFLPSYQGTHSLRELLSQRLNKIKHSWLYQRVVFDYANTMR